MSKTRDSQAAKLLTDAAKSASKAPAIGAGRAPEDTVDLRAELSAAGWEHFDDLDRTLSETLGGLEQDLSLGLRVTGTIEMDGALSRDLLRECRQDDAGAVILDPFDLAGFRMLEPGDPNKAEQAGGPETGSMPAEFDLAGLSENSSATQRWADGFQVLIERTGDRISIERPWAQLLAELRYETSVEPDPQLRSSYIYLVAKLVRMHARSRAGFSNPAAARIAETLEKLAAQGPEAARVALMDRIAIIWEGADPRFSDAVERLEARDGSRDSRDAGERRVSIVLERLLGGDLNGGVEARLEPWLYAPETLAGLVFRGVRAHQQRSRLKAAQLWRQAARYLQEEPRLTVVEAAAYFMREAPGFFQVMMQRVETSDVSRSQLMMMQRRATIAGDHHGEAVVVHRLVSEDVALGRREQNRLESDANSEAPLGKNAWRERLQSLAAARFFRLSTLLRGLNRAREPLASEIDSLAAHRVLHDAVALEPDNRVYLRRLARWSRQRGDLQTCAKALRTLARVYNDPQLAALTATELARTIYLGAGQLQRRQARLVERYLREALVYDSECEPARLALRRLHLIDESFDVPVLDAPAPDEAQMIAAGDWKTLAQRLEQKLETATDSKSWAAIAFRLAQLHSWHLSPIPDARLRAEYLEQVLIADPDHLPALVELLDVRLARGEYAPAVELLERLSEHAATAAERAFWLTELAATLEHSLGQPQRAASAFHAALALEPSSTGALLGLLRTDYALAGSAEADIGVENIVSRLDSGISVREGEGLAVELMLRADASSRARRVLDSRFPDKPLWQFVRLCTSVEAWAEEQTTPELNAAAPLRIDADALASLKRMWLHPRAVEVLRVFEALGAPTAPASDEAPSAGARRDALLARLGRVDSAPAGEGMLIRAMHEARRVEDPQISLLLAALRARRSPDYISRATDLVWMAINFVWLGQDSNALKVCEYVLSRSPDFLPALKLAKILGFRLGRWADLARWCEHDARRTRVEWVAFDARLMASQVQQNYLGDFDAACRQFRTVLERDPGHQEAFENLKSLLLQRGHFAEVLTVFEQRLSHMASVDARVELLNEMSQIALYRSNDGALARRYLMRSQALEPGQLRVLRILGELHQEQGDLEGAIRAYREAITLADSTVLIERLWIGIAELQEAAGRPDQALDAFEQAFEVNPGHVRILLEIARLYMDAGAQADALGWLDRLIAHEQAELNAAQTDLLRDALSRRARCLVELERPHEEILRAFQDLLFAYPQADDAIDVFCEYMRARDQADELEPFFGDLATRSFLEMQGRPFASHFAIARRLGHTERAFCLAAVAEALGYGSAQTEKYYATVARERRWPTRPLPPKIVAELAAPTLQPAFLGVLQHSEAALSTALGQSRLFAAPGDATNRLDPADPSLSPALKMALEWPALFGLALVEAHEFRADSESVGAAQGSLVLQAGQGVRLYLDTRWRHADDPTELLVHLGRQLAAWSLGIGRWQFLDLRTRFLAVSRVVGAHAPGWGSAAAARPGDEIDLESLDAWVDQEGSPELAVHALDLSGRLSVQAVEPQFRLVELTLERAACVLLDDPARFLPHTKHLGSENGMLQQPWSFLFSRLATHIRHHVGVARPAEMPEKQADRGAWHS